MAGIKLKNNKGNIGVFAIGHNVYWQQFPDLKNRLLKHYNHFVKKMENDFEVNIIKYDEICDSFESSKKAASFFSSKNLDLIICYISTYSPSVCAITVLNSLKQIPSVLVCLQPFSKLDYENSTTEDQLENDCITSLPEIVNAIKRVNIHLLKCIIGVLYKDDDAWKDIRKCCDVANVAYKLKNDHIGLMGHVYEGMLDMNSDPTMFEAFFNMHIKHVEMEYLESCVYDATEDEINNKLNEIYNTFFFPDPKSDPITLKVKREDLEWPAKVSVGMDKMVEDLKLTGLAYYYDGANNNQFERLHSGMIVGNSLLTSKGIAISGELDIKNCVAMLIMDRFKAGGSFSELHPVDFENDFVLIGHDGPHHLGIAEGKPYLRKLEILHGKSGNGPSVEYKIKTGPLTLFGITQTYEGKFKFIIAEGQSLPGIIPATGNTNTRFKFRTDIKTFIEKWSLEGPTHHLALGVGHVADRISLLAKYLNIDFIVI